MKMNLSTWMQRVLTVDWPLVGCSVWAKVLLAAGLCAPVAGFMLWLGTGDSLPYTQPTGLGASMNARVVVDGASQSALVVDAASGAVALDVAGNQGAWTTAHLPFAGTPASFLSTTTGRTLHTEPVGDYSDLLAVDQHAHHFVAIDATAGRVYTVDTRDGVVQHRDFSRGPMNPIFLAAATDEQAYRLVATTLTDTSSPAVLQEQAVVIFDTKTGALLHLTHLPGSAPVHVMGPNGPVTAPPLPWSVAIDDNLHRAFVFSTNGMMYVLDSRNGRLLLARSLPLVVRQAIVDARSGHLFAQGGGHDPFFVGGTGLHSSQGKAQTNVIMVDARTGGLLRAQHIGISPATLAGWKQVGAIFIADAASIYVLDARTGRLMRRIGVAGTVRLLVDEQHQRLLVYTVTGMQHHVVVLDAHTGRLLHTSTLNSAAIDMSLDGDTGHLVLLIATPGATRRGDRWAWLPRWLHDRVYWASTPSTIPSTAAGASDAFPKYRHQAITFDPLGRP